MGGRALLDHVSTSFLQKIVARSGGFPTRGACPPCALFPVAPLVLLARATPARVVAADLNVRRLRGRRSARAHRRGRPLGGTVAAASRAVRVAGTALHHLANDRLRRRWRRVLLRRSDVED